MFKKDIVDKQHWWMYIYQLVMWNKWFLKDNSSLSWEEYTLVNWEIDLSQYVSWNLKKLYSYTDIFKWIDFWLFSKKVEEYYNDNWISCEKNEYKWLYYIDWIFYDCKMNLINIFDAETRKNW